MALQREEAQGLFCFEARAHEYRTAFPPVKVSYCLTSAWSSLVVWSKQNFTQGAPQLESCFSIK